MSGDCKQQPHIYYSAHGRKTLEEYYVNRIEALNEEVDRLKVIVDYLESKEKTHHTSASAYYMLYKSKATCSTKYFVGRANQGVILATYIERTMTQILEHQRTTTTKRRMFNDTQRYCDLETTIRNT